MGIRVEIPQKIVKVTTLKKGDTFKTLEKRDPYVISNWEDEDEDSILIAVSLLTGEAYCLNHFEEVIPTNFVITEDV